MRQTKNLNLRLYDSSDNFNITGTTNSLNNNMEIIDKKFSDIPNANDLELINNSISDVKKDMGEKVDISLMRDITNKTPHVATIEKYYSLKRTGKIYQTKIWKFTTNQTPTGEKLLDNAGLEFKPSTDTVEGKDDYLNGDHPLFEWVYCNYKRNNDGTAYPIATEYDENYATSGAVDVGAMQMSFYWNWDASNPEYDLVTISDMPNEKYGLKPWSESKCADGTVLSWCIGSAYISGIASDGLLRSQPGLKPEKWQSYNNMVTNYQKKGKGYWGAGAERNTFQIIFNIIKGATKNSQSLFTGCTSYSFQYSASVESNEKNTYFPVTNSQANNILVDSYVSVGYGVLDSNKTGVSVDRGNRTMHGYADNVKVLRIETLDENNKAIYLDVEDGFNTTHIKLSDTVNAPITLSSMHWVSGTTNNVIGRHDGSWKSNTDSRYPYRVQGREYGIGSYIVASDTVTEAQGDFSRNVYVAPKGMQHSTSDSVIRSDYRMVGTMPSYEKGSYCIGDISVDLETGVFYASSVGSSTSTGFSDYVYQNGGEKSGTREYLMFGYLGNGSFAGSCYVDCWGGLGYSGWRYCAAD